MINSAAQYPVHVLLSHEGNLQYRIPPYQREYSWQKGQWEDLFQDLVESDGSHFLGTIITLNQTTDAADTTVLELIDGQQRMTTLTLLLAAIYAVLDKQRETLDDDVRTDLVNLGRQLVRKGDGKPRVTPQTQGHNLADYRLILAQTGLKIEAAKVPWFGARRIAKCFAYFRDAIGTLAENDGVSTATAALQVLDAVQRAVLVKIEVASHADAFVLFESLNNRGMPLTPVDLIKNHLLAVSDHRAVMTVDEAFKLWNAMLTNLGDTYATQERFLRHYYNAFKAELPAVPNAPVATRAKLIGIYEALLADDITGLVDALVSASALYGRINCVNEPEESSELDKAFRRLLGAQGAPSYVLLMWLLRKRDDLGLTDAHLVTVTNRLTSFFVRRNLTGVPQTYALPKLFMTIIDRVADHGGTADDVAALVAQLLRDASSSDEDFRKRLEGPIYEENSDVARVHPDHAGGGSDDQGDVHRLVGLGERPLHLDDRAHPAPRGKPARGLEGDARCGPQGRSSPGAGRASPREPNDHGLQQFPRKQVVRREARPHRCAGPTHRLPQRAVTQRSAGQP